MYEIVFNLFSVLLLIAIYVLKKYPFNGQLIIKFT